MNGGRPGNGFLILHHVGGIGGNPVQFPAVVHHDGAHPLFILQRICAGEERLEHAVPLMLHGAGMAIPAAEITGEVHLLGGRRPFPVVPALACLVEAEIPVAVGKIRQGFALFQEYVLGTLVVCHPQFQIALERPQTGIIRGDFQCHGCHPFKLVSLLSCPVRVPVRYRASLSPQALPYLPAFFHCTAISPKRQVSGKNTLISAFPSMPGTRPALVYCHILIL